MALFPSDDVRPEEDAARRRAVTQEAGTRRLVLGFIALVAIWFIVSRVWDAYLLRHTWAPVPAEETGLTVVSTLDRRGEYDTNLFKVVQSEGEARAELTNYGWEGIFSGKHGPLTSAATGSAIKSAIQQDSDTGYAMLAPILAAEVRSEMGNPKAYNSLSEDYKITTTVPISEEEIQRKHIAPRTKSLRELVDFFAKETAASKNGGSDTPEGGGSGSSQHAEHGLVIPPEILVKACPIVLSTRHFSGGRVEEHPEVIMGGKTYSIWLDLTPEGRSRFYQWSRDHVRENLMLILNGAVVAHGRIAMTMDVSTWEITNLKDGPAAHKLVDYINSHRGSR